MFDKTTDFATISRLTDAAVLEQKRMPPLDFVMNILGELGLINLVSGDTEPVTNQATTAWFDTAANDFTTNGELKLWDATLGIPAYVTATPALFKSLISITALGVGAIDEEV